MTPLQKEEYKNPLADHYHKLEQQKTVIRIVFAIFILSLTTYIFSTDFPVGP